MLLGTAKTILLSLMLLLPSSIFNIGMTMAAAQVQPGCYDSDGVAIADCQCHESCSACGYTPFPTSSVDCISCADSTISVTQIFVDGTGICGNLEVPSEPGCYDFSGNLDPDCTCASTCSACLSNSDTKDYECLTCADSNIAVTPVITDGGSGFCGSSEDFPCVLQLNALLQCVVSIETTCPEFYTFFATEASGPICTDTTVQRVCKVAKGEECSTCATQAKEFLQCTATMTDESIKENLWENGRCFDSTVCGFSSSGDTTSADDTSSSSGPAKFGSLVVSFSFAWVAFALLATVI